MNKRTWLSIAVIVTAFLGGVVACAQTASGQNTPGIVPAVEKLDMPNGAFAVQTFCSHGFRVWQSWRHNDNSSGGNSSVALAVQPDAGCAK